MRYLLIVPVVAYELDSARFAIESAFALHLSHILELISPEFDEIVVAGVAMDEAAYQIRRGYMEVIEAKSGIRFFPLFRESSSSVTFVLTQFVPALLRLRKLVDSADLVHAGPSHRLSRPFEFIGLMRACRRGIPTVSVSDIDLRPAARMLHAAGLWSRRTKIVCQYLYDPVRNWQQRVIARRCSLVLFKEGSLIEDYGSDRSNVEFFRDPGVSRHQIVPVEVLSEKRHRIRSCANPVELLYFGRLVPYKGVEHMIEAFALARERDANVSLSIMGAGEEETSLRRFVDQRLSNTSSEPQSLVRFIEPVPYGDGFFAELARHDVLLAASLGPDTPRSVWDAFAAGMPIAAYDTPFYRELGKWTGAVRVSPWLQPKGLSDSICALDSDRESLAEMMSAARAAANENTEEDWLERRMEWTRTILKGRSGAPDSSDVMPTQARI